MRPVIIDEQVHTEGPEVVPTTVSTGALRDGLCVMPVLHRGCVLASAKHFFSPHTHPCGCRCFLAHTPSPAASMVAIIVCIAVAIVGGVTVIAFYAIKKKKEREYADFQA